MVVRRLVYGVSMIVLGTMKINRFSDSSIGDSSFLSAKKGNRIFKSQKKVLDSISSDLLDSGSKELIGE